MRRTNSNSTLAIWTVFAALAVWISFTIHQQDSKTCTVPLMWVAYAPIAGLTTQYSRFAQKYSLYLVRSSPYEIPQPIRPAGIPVLFVPGNAGSYRQIRSITDTARELNEQLGLLTKDDAGSEFDFFALDFNEAYSALHGRTLLDQAEYLNDAVAFLLEMYRHNRRGDETLPGSVILVGHSMGGIVSRVALTLDNYIPGTVNTIITLASPHLVPPATFDADITKVYHLANDYWRGAYSEGESEENPLRDVTILSIAGGKLDTMVPSDYVSLDSLVPASNGLSTFANSVPRVWSGIDHDAMVWCHQLRRQIASALFQIADPQVSSQTKPRDQRMEVFHRLFSGVQSVDVTMQDFLDIEAAPLQQGQKQVLPNGFYFGRNIQLLTSHTINDNSPLDMYEKKSGSLLKAYQCRSRQGSSFRQCKKIHPLYVPQGETVLSYVSVDGYLLLQQEDSSNDWVSVDETSMTAAPFNPYGTTTFTTSNSVSQDVAFPALTSGLISYKVHVSGGIWLLRQYVGRHHASRTFDSKFLTPFNGRVDVSFHGDAAPFVPYKLKPPTKTDFVSKSYLAPLHLQVFGRGSVSIQVDYLGSIGNIFMRYRTLLFALPTSVLYAVLLLQFSTYYGSGQSSKFLSIREATGIFIRQFLPWACLGVAFLSYLVGFERVRDLLHLIQIPITSSNKSYEVEKFYGSGYTHNDLFLGLSGPIGVILAPLFLLFSTGVVVIVSETVTMIITLGSLVLNKKRSPTSVPTDVTIVRSDDPIGDLMHKRTVIIGLMAFLVLLFFPYQLAFVLATVSVLVMAIFFGSDSRSNTPDDLSTSIYATRQAQEKIGSFINYISTISVVMVWTTLVNVPVLAVWVQGIVVQRSTIFSSHHNLVSILPTLLFIENLSFRRMPESVLPVVTYILLGYISVHCVVYGMMHAFMIHHGFNLLSGWLLFTSYKRITRKDRARVE